MVAEVDVCRVKKGGGVTCAELLRRSADEDGKAGWAKAACERYSDE